MVRVPVLGPGLVGEKVIWRRQEAVGAISPVQAGPPVAALLRAKSPVVVVELRVMGEGLRLVRVKRVGAVVLLMGVGPKSFVSGVSWRPVRARPLPVRARE